MSSIPQDPANPEKKKAPSALRSVIAGSTAGAIEIGASFPLRRVARLLTGQPSPTQPNVRCSPPLAAPRPLTNSRQNTIPAEPPPRRGPEATVAAVRRAMVRGLHNAHHRQLRQGRHPYVIHDARHTTNNQGLWRLISSKAFSPTKTASYLARGRCWPVSAPVSRSRYWLSRRQKASRRHCTPHPVFDRDLADE